MTPKRIADTTLCAICKEPFSPATINQKYCSTCGANPYRARNPRPATIICCDCGESTPYARNRRRCESCADKKKSETAKNWAVANYGRLCVDCKINAATPRSHRCADCRDKHRKERRVQYNSDYHQKQRLYYRKYQRDRRARNKEVAPKIRAIHAGHLQDAPPEKLVELLHRVWSGELTFTGVR